MHLPIRLWQRPSRPSIDADSWHCPTCIRIMQSASQYRQYRLQFPWTDLRANVGKKNLVSLCFTQVHEAESCGCIVLSSLDHVHSARQTTACIFPIPSTQSLQWELRAVIVYIQNGQTQAPLRVLLTSSVIRFCICSPLADRSSTSRPKRSISIGMCTSGISFFRMQL